MQLGIYEKAFPTEMPICEKIVEAKHLGLDFIELSIDEQDFRIDRLKWTKEERISLMTCLKKHDMRMPSLCLSAHRRFPMGSKDPIVRNRALEIMKDAIDLADDLGIRVIQLAGYDVYYEPKSLETHAYFVESLQQSMQWAHEKQVTLSIEIMDDVFINSLSKFKQIQGEVKDRDLKAYLDVGNLSAWPENDVADEINRNIKDIVAVHLKDTLAVTETFEGKFKNVIFGSGCVNFPGVLMTLNKAHYQGPYLIEMWTQENIEADRKRIRTAKEFILDAMVEGGISCDTK